MSQMSGHAGGLTDDERSPFREQFGGSCIQGPVHWADLRQAAAVCAAATVAMKPAIVTTTKRFTLARQTPASRIADTASGPRSC
jgi:hypothetical protein